LFNDRFLFMGDFILCLDFPTYEDISFMS